MGFRRYLWRALSIVAPRRRVRSRGLQFTLQYDNQITRYRWRTYNSKEPETLDWIDRFVQQGDIFFDIGANIGLYSIYAALRHPRIRVVAVEPEYANLHLLRDNIIENGLQDRVQVYSVAIGDHTGLSRLHIQDFTPGAGLHVESRAILKETRIAHPVVWREGICTFTLDEFCRQTGLHPTWVKVDVDGTEVEILKGAARTLRSATFQSMLIELPNEQEAYRPCEQLLLDAPLWRERRGVMYKDSNDIWVRHETGATRPSSGSQGQATDNLACGNDHQETEGVLYA